jgi:sarcosine oxidase delta subunit
MDGAAKLGLEQRGAAKAIYKWLEKTIGLSPDEEDLKSLRTRAWVLAERGDALEFKKPSEVLLHPGEKVLGARFWVRAMPLPDFRQQELSSLGFATKPEATASQLAEIGECLVERAELEDKATVQVYELVGQLLEEVGTLRERWQSIAGCRSVYRAFREKERQVTSVQLFLGDTEDKEDLSTNLLCLKSSGPPPTGVIAIYRDLGVPDRPSVVQLLHALGATTAKEPNAASSYACLIRTFLKLASDTELALDPKSLAAIRILTCAGTYQPIADCLWDATLDRPKRILHEHAHLLIDSTDKPTQALVEWLRDQHSGVLVNLRTTGEFEPADAPVPMAETPEVSYLLSPWRQWFQQATREESSLRDELSRLGLALPTTAVTIVPVRKIRIRCRLRAGNVIEQSEGWEGPLAFAHTKDRLYVRIEERKPDDRTVGDRFRAVDKAIALEIAILLGSSAASAHPHSLEDGITATLERPSTVLKRLHESNRQHFLHQFHDQVANQAFADLFEEFQRTSQSTKRGQERVAELESKMFALLESEFVQARREQIKGYGYNEFSVFAELLQNAEDAYLQRQQLGMDMPEPCGILYRYIQEAGAGRVLEVEHLGRPFNYWQHGPKQDRNFAKDVEGVLRSAGSFKPHSGASSGQSSGTAAIGRFGLGFKSVYLITDCPEVYSGDWHFAIESGCLPKELSPPVDLPQTTTRIRLPLRVEAEDFKDASQLLGLLPFLSMTTRLEFRPLIGEPTTMLVKTVVLHKGAAAIVEQVDLSAPGAVRGDSVRLIRCRSSAHAGQLAFLVTQEGIPARWDEVFQQDLYAALPLQAKLGCGAAASHRFEVQSGRTHLVDPKANAAKITEVTALLGGLVDGLCIIALGGPPLSEVLRRFWSIWQWERGDGECDALRRSLAAELTGLAERKALVPTLDPGHPISLGSGPCFYFTEIPDDFRTALVEAGVTVTAGGHPVTALAPKNVVLEGFATAYRRACDYAGLKVSKTLAGIGWAEVAAAFRERAWFAETPTLLNRLAGCLNEDQSRKAGEWIALCKVLVEGGEQSNNYLLPCDLLMADFAGKKHLPRRLLRCLSAVYHKSSAALLGFAGLRPCPSANDIREWIQTKNVSEAEALGILAFLAEDSRFMGYRELADVFRKAWFPTNGQRLTTKQAADKKLIPESILEDEVFRAWLGLTDQVDKPEPEPPPPLDPKDVLAKLFDWWQEEGPAWTQRYERRLYPTGRLPSIQETFYAKDLGDRREWLTLLLLASLHTIGRTRLEQHRNFLSRCDEKGWLDVFADGEYDARRWMEVIENYLEDPAGSHDYYQWMKQFVVMFQISRWLPEYVESFLQVNRRRGSFALDAITAPRTDAANSGGGPDAPALTRALGFGVCFVLRELTRLGILQQELAHRHCYVPGGRVCEVLEALGCPDLRSLPATIRSSAIHKFLVENMEEGRATFGLTFDLPLLALGEDVDLQRKLCGRPLLTEDNGTSSAGHDEGWRTLPDGRRIKLW